MPVGAVDAAQAAHDAWLARALPEEPFEPDLLVIDAHHHLWFAHPTRGFAADYMLRELALDIARSGHTVTHTCYMQSGTAGWARPDAPGAPAGTGAVGESAVAQGVASIAASGRYGPTRACAGIVATCDLTLGAAVGPVLDAHAAAAANFRGVRFLGGKAERIDFGSGAVEAALAELDRRGLVLDCNGPETHPLDFNGVLGDRGLAGAARRFPSLQVVVDHCGGAVGPRCFSDAAKRAEWEGCIAALAALPNVAVKIGGLHMEVNGFPIGPSHSDRPPMSEELAGLTFDLYAHTIRAFGPGRCMAESNFPVDRWSAPYGTVWSALKRVASRAGLSRPEREALFSGTAARVYRLGDVNE